MNCSSMFRYFQKCSNNIISCQLSIWILCREHEYCSGTYLEKWS